MSFVVTVDGPAGAGKSSVARRLSSSVGLRYLDTGAIYRAIALTLDRMGIPPEDTDALKGALTNIKVELRDDGISANGADVSLDIRTPRVDAIVSAYSALGCVRKALLGFQRDQARYGSLIAEGRDVGSAVFPDAPLKFFLTASPEARARRRCLERERRGERISYEEVLAGIKERDRLDSEREISPLRCPEDAVLVDTSDMTEDDVTAYLEERIRSAMLKGDAGA